MRHDCSLLPSIAHSLRILQIFCGRPDLTLTFGEHSENIVKMLDKLGPLPVKSDTLKDSDFSALLIIDRDKDFASPLLTPAIYSALLLEVVPNNAGILELDMSKNKIQQQKIPIFTVDSKRENKTTTNKSPTNMKTPTIRLNSMQDEIFAENRYKHFSAASSQIRQQAKSISMELQKLNNMKLEEMHDYVNRKLPKISDTKTKLLKHLNASEKVIEMLGSNFRRVQALEEDILNNVSRKKILQDIDELLTTDGQKYNTLRLLSLLHVCAGITTEELTQFVRNYCNYFGLKYLTIFEQLSQVGLLPCVLGDIVTPINKTASKLLSNIPLNIQKFQQTQFQANANRLKLMVSVADADEPECPVSASTSTLQKSQPSTCPSYVFNRLYIPLIAQIANFLLKSTNGDDFISKFAMIDNFKINGQDIKSLVQSVKQTEYKDLLPLKKRQIFIYIVGGITYTEIAACNLVAKVTESEIFVASDCILSGSDLIAAAF